ncbi:MAG: beta-hydroxyacyl-ACP dehydratase [Rhizobiales bacterium]|nr:beta-hydroxyacyl-ACP dehydratase [Hyphomicrobiales bacterium]
MRIDYFQLIDRIVEIDIAARTIRTEAAVPQTSTIFEGHFPGYPILPGVLLIEAMAQTSGWLVIAMTRFERMPFLAAVKEAKLRRFVPPGEQLTLSATLAHEGSGYAVADAQGIADGKLVCDAQITFRVVDFPGPEFRSHMEEMAKRLAFPLGARADG